MTETRKIDVCDDCMLVAYDKGIETHGEQAMIMVTLGKELEDHICIVREEPDEDFTCDCACNSDRFKKMQRDRKQRLTSSK